MKGLLESEEYIVGEDDREDGLSWFALGGLGLALQRISTMRMDAIGYVPAMTWTAL